MQPVNQGEAQSFLDRLLGVLKLDAFTWNGIKLDPAANGQAWLIVLLTGLISGIGSARNIADATLQFQTAIDEAAKSDPELAAQLQTVALQSFDSPGGRISMIVSAIIGAVIAWLLFAALSRWAARQFFGADPNAASNEQMRRLTGWAYAPALLNILAPIPLLGTIATIAAAIWVLVSQVQAVKHGMNLTTGKAIGASIVAWIVPALVLILLVCACIGIVAATGGVTQTP